MVHLFFLRKNKTIDKKGIWADNVGKKTPFMIFIDYFLIVLGVFK